VQAEGKSQARQLALNSSESGRGVNDVRLKSGRWHHACNLRVDSLGWSMARREQAGDTPQACLAPKKRPNGHPCRWEQCDLAHISKSKDDETIQLDA